MTSTSAQTARQPIPGDLDPRAELIAQHAREDERRRIARDLHDDISQQFALLTLDLDLLRQHPAASHPDMRQRLDAVLARAQQIGTSVRHVSHQLHAPRLGDLDLALRRLSQEVAASYDLRVHLVCDLMPASLRGALALALFRIVQEALHNIVKHSGARHVTIEAIGRSDAVRLRIVDDGRGFDVDALDGTGVGLVSMRERLEPFDGQLSISSAPSHGTRIEVSVPMWQTESAAA